MHGHIGARRGFVRTVLEKLDLVESQLPPVIEPLPSLGEPDFSLEEIDLRLRKNDMIILMRFSCDLNPEGYGKAEKLPMFNVCVLSIEEEPHKRDLEFVVSIEPLDLSNN